MKISKRDIDWNENNVHGISQKMTPQLDSLTENEGPREQEYPQLDPAFLWPGQRRLIPGAEDEHIVHEGPRGNGCLQHRIRAPWLRPKSTNHLLAMCSEIVVAQRRCNQYSSWPRPDLAPPWEGQCSGATNLRIDCLPLNHNHLPPVMSFHKHARQIASPITAHPAEALAEVFWAVFQRRQHLGIAVILHGYLPIVRIDPARNEVVVIGVWAKKYSFRFD
jgi:hypothetical protein